MGSERFERVGAVGRDEIAKFYNCDVIGVWDQRHFLHAAMSAASHEARYSLDDPKMQSLIASIQAQGWLQPGEVWFFEDSQTAHVVFGNRRTFATDYINFERMSEEKDPIVGRYKVVIKKALTPELVAEGLARYADENNRRVANDWMTIADAAARELKLGVDIGIVLAHWPMIESEALLERLTKDNGIRAACPQLQAALATGQIKLRRALQIADLPLAQQVAAMQTAPAKRGQGGPSAVPLAKLRRLAAENKFNGLSAGWLLRALTEPDFAPTDPTAQDLRELLAERAKPGPKPRKPLFPAGSQADGLTPQERVETQAFLDAEAAKREAEENQNAA